MRVTKLDIELSRNKEFRKMFPSGMARAYNRIFDSIFCALIPWAAISGAEVGTRVDSLVFRWASEEVLARNGWATTRAGKNFIKSENQPLKKAVKTSA